LTVNPEKLMQAPFRIDPEFEAKNPKMSLEKYNLLKADIKAHGGIPDKPIEVMSDGKKTIVDGHHRYRACTELKTPEYKIPFTVLNISNLQQALEYSFRLGNNRKNLNTYQEATWALGVYGSNCTDKEIATKLGMDAGNLSKIKKLNNILVNYNSPAIASEYLSKLNSGVIGYTVALQELNNAENIDSIIAVIDSKGKLYYQTARDKVNRSTMTPQQVRAFKAEMEAKYFETKYDKKALKQLNVDIDKLENPEFYEKVEKGYHSDVQPIVKKLNKLEEKYDKLVTLYNVTTEDAFDEASNYLLSKRGQGRMFAMVLLELPKDMIQG
jgi:hypothetical protein